MSRDYGEIFDADTQSEAFIAEADKLRREHLAMPDDITAQLDALEALRETAGIYLPASVLGGMGATLFFEMHSPARMGATAEYVETLVNAAPALIAKHREDAATIAALREVAKAAEQYRHHPLTIIVARRLDRALANLKGAHHA